MAQFYLWIFQIILLYIFSSGARTHMGVVNMVATAEPWRAA